MERGVSEFYIAFAVSLFFFFLRLLGASYPGPVGSGSCDPPSTFFNDDDMKSVDIFYSGC